MKIYLKRDNSSLNSRYVVYDELGLPKYTIVGKHSASGERMYIMQDESVVAKMRDTRLGVLKNFTVTDSGSSARIIITNKGSNISINFRGVSWHIRGDVLAKSYDILNVDNSVIAAVSAFSTFGRDSLEININNDNKELFCIASVVCIDSIATAATPVMQMS